MPGTLVYALGGGWGHLTRALALGAQPILTNSPYADRVRQALPDTAILSVHGGEVRALIAAAKPDLLIVDTFPRGLRGELADLIPALGCPKILIHRDLDPDYVQQYHLREYVAAHYHRVILPGEGDAFADLPIAVRTEPWIVRAPQPLAEPPPDIVVCASGNASELPWYGAVMALLAHENARCLAPDLPPNCPPDRWIHHWPAIDWIAAARVVIGGAGYNTVHECQACQTPLIAKPWPRLYDRQLHRARRAGATLADTPQQAADAARLLLRAR